MPFAATWMELQTLILSEVTQKEKDKFHMISHIWNLVYDTNEPFHGLREQTCGCQGGRGRCGMEVVLVVNRCRLLPLEWISNEILLCSTGNYVCSLVMEHDNVRKKECIHVCLTGSPCCAAENRQNTVKPAIMEKQNH